MSDIKARPLNASALCLLHAGFSSTSLCCTYCGPRCGTGWSLTMAMFCSLNHMSQILALAFTVKFFKKQCRSCSQPIKCLMISDISGEIAALTVWPLCRSAQLSERIVMLVKKESQCDCNKGGGGEH